MICILAFGPRGMADLAHCLGVEKATLTGVADRAERRGLVIRSPVPGDRRALDVTLTATGPPDRRRIPRRRGQEAQHFLSPLTLAELDQFRRAMAKIVAGAPTGHTRRRHQGNDPLAGVEGDSP